MGLVTSAVINQIFLQNKTISEDWTIADSTSLIFGTDSDYSVGYYASGDVLELRSGVVENTNVAITIDASGVKTLRTPFTMVLFSDSHNPTPTADTLGIKQTYNHSTTDWVTTADNSVSSVDAPLVDYSALSLYERFALMTAEVSITFDDHSCVTSLTVANIENLIITWEYTYDGGSNWIVGGTYTDVLLDTGDSPETLTLNFDVNTITFQGKLITGDVLVRLCGASDGGLGVFTMYTSTNTLETNATLGVVIA